MSSNRLKPNMIMLTVQIQTWFLLSSLKSSFVPDKVYLNLAPYILKLKLNLIVPNWLAKIACW